MWACTEVDGRSGDGGVHKSTVKSHFRTPTDGIKAEIEASGALVRAAHQLTVLNPARVQKLTVGIQSPGVHELTVSNPNRRTNPDGLCMTRTRGRSKKPRGLQANTDYPYTS